jgi:hypothetical protein
VLPLGNGMNAPAAKYTYDVRKGGMLVAETEFAKQPKEPSPCKQEGLCLEGGSYIDSSVPPHQTITEELPVSDHRDMSQPGKYTIQLRELYSFSPGHQGEVKSNIATVTVEP